MRFSNTLETLECPASTFRLNSKASAVNIGALTSGVSYAAGATTRPPSGGPQNLWPPAGGNRACHAAKCRSMCEEGNSPQTQSAL